MNERLQYAVHETRVAQVDETSKPAERRFQDELVSIKTVQLAQVGKRRLPFAHVAESNQLLFAQLTGHLVLNSCLVLKIVTQRAIERAVAHVDAKVVGAVGRVNAKVRRRCRANAKAAHIETVDAEEKAT